MATRSKKLMQAQPNSNKRASPVKSPGESTETAASTDASTGKSTGKPTGKADRDTLEKLRAHVDDIEKRLKRANTLTLTSVKALKSSYEALDGDSHTSALTGHIEVLSDRLTGMIEQTRRDVAHDLKIVLGDPRLETLSGALTKANQRLTSAEQNQAEAINAINLHIARLATAVDNRMRTEEQRRQEADAILTRRVEKVEQDSALAIKTIGDKFATVSEDMAIRLQNQKGKMAEEALERQQDYEEHKHIMASRIEAIEDEQRNQIPAIERSMATLSTRLETLEQSGRFETVPETAIPDPAYQIPPVMQAEQAQENIPPEAEETQDNSALKPTDAFAALELVDSKELSPPQLVTKPEPYEPQSSTPVFAPEFDQEADTNSIFTSEQTSTLAPYGVEGEKNAQTEATQFSPRDYAPHSAEYVAQTPSAPAPYIASDTSIQEYDPGLNQDALAPTLSPTPETIAVPPMPGADPSFALAPNSIRQDPMPMSGPPPMLGETVVLDLQTPEPVTAPEPTMENARPGADPLAKTRKAKFHKDKTRKSKKPGNGGSGGNHVLIRKIALFGGVAVVALFAYNTVAPKIFKTDKRASLNTQPVPNKQLANVRMSEDMSGDTGFARPDDTTIIGDESLQPAEPLVETIEPIGDYSQAMSAPDLGSSGDRANANKQTLETAAASGDAVAQFQLGLSHLEAGRDAEALRLIRLAANQGQPAAQYRLAKLYEAGIGVKVNGKTAKGLLIRAAKADNRIAMHDLGHYYATGADGSSPDITQAVSWFSQAAERGVLDSQFNLGVLYQGGSGVPRSLKDAYFWYTIAGLQGDKIAKQRSEAIALELSSENLKTAQARVKAFAPKPVNNAANGVFTNLPWTNTGAKGDTKTSIKTSVKAAQQMLTTLGYDVGRPDGAMGPNTRNAIISFERANGMPETGRVNAALITRLKLAAGA